MIERLKNTRRILLLTTHSMEEADALGDKVAILHQGRLRAAGSSLFLKAKYGKGYTVSIQADEHHTGTIQNILTNTIPSAELVATASGNHSISLPKSAVASIPSLLGSLMRQTGLVKEWGISNTTLEEVFLRLASQNVELNGPTQDQLLSDMRSRIMLVRRQPGHDTSAQDATTLPAPSPRSEDVLCVLESGSAADDFVVLSGDVEVLPAPPVSDIANDTTEHSMMGAFAVAADEAPRRSAAGALPSEPRQQLVEFEVPEGAIPGRQVPINIGGQDIFVEIPTDAIIGQRLHIAVPLPQVDATPVSNPLSNSEDGVQDVHATFCEQTLAIILKNLPLALGCRCSRGCHCSFKCCELFCYVTLFVIFAFAAVITQLFSDVQESFSGQSASTFCPNGVLNASYSPGRGYDCGFAGGMSTCNSAEIATAMVGMGNSWKVACMGNDGFPALKTCPLIMPLRGTGQSSMMTSCWADLIAGPYGFEKTLENNGNNNFQYYSSCSAAELSPQRDHDHQWDDKKRTLCALPISIWYTGDLSVFVSTDELHREHLESAWASEPGYRGPPWRICDGSLHCDRITIPGIQFTAVSSIDESVMAAQTALQRRAQIMPRNSSSCVGNNPSRDHALLVDDFVDAQQYMLKHFPAFGIEILHATPTSSSSSAAISVDYAIKLWGCAQYRYASATAMDSCDTTTAPMSDGCLHLADVRTEIIIGAVSNGLLRSLGSKARLSAVIVPMPKFLFAVPDDHDVPMFWLMMYPLLSSLLLPSMSALVATEKEDELIQMIKSAGGRMDAYFTGNYLFIAAYSLFFTGKESFN
eukprot:SAG31_NODE_241_length_19364_cov_17.168544_8_plen_811_part_00